MTLWAITVRPDIFLAPGWALPLQRFTLIALSVLIVFGIGVHTWANDLLPISR